MGDRVEGNELHFSALWSRSATIDLPPRNATMTKRRAVVTMRGTHDERDGNAETTTTCEFGHQIESRETEIGREPAAVDRACDNRP